MLGNERETAQRTIDGKATEEERRRARQKFRKCRVRAGTVGCERRSKTMQNLKNR